MRITERHLRQIIKEELRRELREWPWDSAECKPLTKDIMIKGDGCDWFGDKAKDPFAITCDYTSKPIAMTYYAETRPDKPHMPTENSPLTHVLPADRWNMLVDIVTAGREPTYEEMKKIKGF